MDVYRKRGVVIIAGFLHNGVLALASLADCLISFFKMQSMMDAEQSFEDSLIEQLIKKLL